MSSISALAATQPVGGPFATGGVVADRFEIGALLGEGGMGAVFLARDRELEEDVALKILRPEIAEAPGALDRFRREVKLARRVTHVNVARTYDLGTAAGVRYLTMELIAGDSLAHRFRQERISLVESLRIAAEIGRGLAAAHAVGVVHRDLKPENVMLSGPRVVITDFGIARLAASIDPARTVGVAMGTPAYMAPEQIEGRDLDGRADVYALGLVLYQILTGELPFTGDTPWALAASRLEDRTIDPRAVDPAIPANIAELVTASLARKREQRLDAAQFGARLDAIRGEVPVPAFVTPPREVKAAPARSVSIDPGVGPEFASVLATSLGRLQGLSVLLLPGATADLSIRGSRRTAGSRTRVALSLVDGASGKQLWCEDFAGTTEDPFALEDAVVAGTCGAVQQRMSGEAAPVSRANDTLARARDLIRSFALDRVLQAIALLREARRENPDDPVVLNALGRALVRASRSGGDAETMLAEAEEVTLRALSVDATSGETFAVIGTLRATKGELRAAVRAFEEAAKRAPLLAEPHAWLGRLLWESGRRAEADRRIDHALALDPDSVVALGERVCIYGICGRSDEAVRLLDALADRGVPRSSSVFLRARLALWSLDPTIARDSLQLVEEHGGEMRGVMESFVAALTELTAGRPPVEAARVMAARARRDDRGTRQNLQPIAIDLLLAARLPEEALQLLAERADRFLDLGWLDHAPLIATLRDDPRFAAARASMAARAADLWS